MSRLIVNGLLEVSSNIIGEFVKKPKKVRLYGLRKYWPTLTQQQAEVERQKLYEKQEGRCAVCKKHESEFKIRLSVDHNHKTGQVRGLLCYRCNKFIVGRHTYETAKKVLEYLVVELKVDQITDEERRKRKVLKGIVCQHDDSSWCTESCPRGKIYE